MGSNQRAKGGAAWVCSRTLKADSSCCVLARSEASVLQLEVSTEPLGPVFLQQPKLDNLHAFLKVHKCKSETLLQVTSLTGLPCLAQMALIRGVCPVIP